MEDAADPGPVVAEDEPRPRLREHSDTDDQPAPGAILDATVSLVNDVHVRVRWTAPTGASSYRVYRSTDPRPGTFLLLGETVENPQMQALAPEGFSWASLAVMLALVGVLVPFVEGFPDDCWVARTGIEEASPDVQYVRSLYWAVTTMTSTSG